MGKKKKHKGKYDILDFKLIDPVEKGEEWTVLGPHIDKRMAVEICVNNREMLSVVRGIEKHYRPDDDLKLNGLGYGHVVPGFLYKDTDAAKVCFENACLAFEYRKKHGDDERFYAADYKNAFFLLDRLKGSDKRECRPVFEVYPPVEIAKTDKETEFLDFAAAALKNNEDAYAVARLAEFYRHGIFADRNESFADYLDNTAVPCFPEGAG